MFPPMGTWVEELGDPAARDLRPRVASTTEGSAAKCRVVTSSRARRARRATLVLALLATHCTLADGEATGDGGLHVDVQVAAPAASATTWASASGDTIELTLGYVAISSVEIVACEGGSLAQAGWRWPGIGVAHAHSSTSPRKLGVPGVVPLAPREAVRAELGSLEPPPGTYCEARVVLGPADGDALMLPEGVAMVGHSLVIEGRVIDAGDGTSTPFRLESQATIEIVGRLRFELAEEGPHEAQLSVELGAVQPFSGIDAAELLAGGAGEVALANVAAGVQIASR